MSFIQAFINTLLSMQTPEMYQTVLPRVAFTLIGVVCAVIILALYVVPAVVTKKNMVIAIVAGVTNFLSAILMPLYVRLFHTLPIVVEVQPGTMNEAMGNLISTLIKSFGLLALMALMIIGFVLSIVYICKGFKFKPAIFAVGALIINILRYLYIAPYQAMFPVIFKLVAPENPATVTIMAFGQAFQLLVYYVAMMLPLLLILFASLISKSKEKKLAKAEEAKEKAEAEVVAEAKAEAEAEVKAEDKAEEKTEDKVEEKPAEKKAEETK